jgi:hypothetical protein
VSGVRLTWLQPSVVLDEVVRTGARLHVLTLDRLRSFELL